MGLVELIDRAGEKNIKLKQVRELNLQPFIDAIGRESLKLLMLSGRVDDFSFLDPALRTEMDVDFKRELEAEIFREGSTPYKCAENINYMLGAAFILSFKLRVDNREIIMGIADSYTLDLLDKVPEYKYPAYTHILDAFYGAEEGLFEESRDPKVKNNLVGKYVQELFLV